MKGTLSTRNSIKSNGGMNFVLYLAEKSNYMESKISEGVKVSVETFYQQDYSNPLQSEFMFAYRITIENHNYFPVKLHSRRWHIFDSAVATGEVEGEGVVGMQPVISAGGRISLCKWM